MSLEHLKKFIDWNVKMMKDDTPVVKYGYHNDGQGNKYFAMDIFGMKVRQEQHELIEEEQIDMIPRKKVKRIGRVK